MKRELINSIYAQAEIFGGRDVTVCGWARSIRDSKSFGFIDLNDGSGFKGVQIVFEREKINNYDEIASLNVGSSVIVKGKVILTPENKQPFEINADEIVVEGTSTPDYPLQKKRHTVEYLREQAYLRPRTNLFSEVFRVRSEIAFAIHEFFNSRGFVYVHTPLITASDCEGAGEMFRVTTLDVNDPPRTKDGTVDWSEDFFGKSANLTVSGQLEGETYALAFGNIYTFGPTFRAENSNTARHAAEFWMIEPEIAFCDLDGDMEIMESMLKYVVKYVLENAKDEISFCDKFVETGLIDKLTKLVNSKFTRITHKEAITLLKEAKVNWEFKPEYGEDIAKEHEKYITEYFDGPVFITDWPKDIKAFYMK